MDTLFIENFRLPASVGIYQREKAAPQTIELSLWIGTSVVKAGTSDDIQDSIDYAEVIQCLRAELATRRFNLLEKLAEFVASVLLERYEARWTRVSVTKLGAMRDIGRVGVIIERNAPG